MNGRLLYLPLKCRFFFFCRYSASSHWTTTLSTIKMVLWCIVQFRHQKLLPISCHVCGKWKNLCAGISADVICRESCEKQTGEPFNGHGHWAKLCEPSSRSLPLPKCYRWQGYHVCLAESRASMYKSSPCCWRDGNIYWREGELFTHGSLQIFLY